MYRHVCYAPELETIEETRHKLFIREGEVTRKLEPLTKKDQVTLHGLDSNPASSQQLVDIHSDYTAPSCPEKPRILTKTSAVVVENIVQPTTSKSHPAPKPVKRIVYHEKSKRLRLSSIDPPDVSQKK